MENFLLLAVIVFMGFLVKFPKAKRFNFLKSFLVVYFQVILAGLLFLALLLLVIGTPLKRMMIRTPDSLFVVVLLIALINGIVLYWLNRLILPKFRINNQVQTLCEYIIQWSLIYITVYQVIFDNLLESANLLHNPQQVLESFDIMNPSDMIMLVLPSLISVWIGIIVYKVHRDTI